MDFYDQTPEIELQKAIEKEKRAKLIDEITEIVVSRILGRLNRLGKTIERQNKKVDMIFKLQNRIAEGLDKLDKE